MSLVKRKNQRRHRRTLRVRSAFTGSTLPRVSIFRSLNHIYGQVIDDMNGKTLVSCSTLELENLKGSKSEKAHAVGLELAKRALSNGISKAKFDRGRFLYHGRVKSFADGLRQAGMQL
jgi:large subunit ribosomal protein L18